MAEADPNLSELMRQAQQRAAAVQAANQQPLTDQVRMNMMPADLDPNVKQQLLKVPEPQFRVILQSYMMNLRRSNGMQNGAFPPGQPNAGQPNMPFNQQQQLPPGMTGQMLGGPNMPNMVRPGMNLGQPQPGAGPQPPMGAQRPPMPSQQQRLQAASNLLRANPGIIHATDPKPFPPNVLNNSIRNSLPQDVRTWQQLKLWAHQNPAATEHAEHGRPSGHPTGLATVSGKDGRLATSQSTRRTTTRFHDLTEDEESTATKAAAGAICNAQPTSPT